jgi:predicted nucleic acid-binding protein
MKTPLTCVIDTNILLKHFIPDPLSPQVDLLLTHLTHEQTSIHIPDLFYIENANVLWKYVRAGQLNSQQAQAHLKTLKALPFQVTSTSDLLEAALNIALEFTISAYDACYIVLADQINAPLLTLDQKLLKALSNSSHNVVDFSKFIVPPLN